MVWAPFTKPLMPPFLLQCPQDNSESAWKDTKVLSPAYGLLVFLFSMYFCAFTNISSVIFLGDFPPKKVTGCLNVCFLFFWSCLLPVGHFIRIHFLLTAKHKEMGVLESTWACGFEALYALAVQRQALFLSNEEAVQGRSCWCHQEPCVYPAKGPLNTLPSSALPFPLCATLGSAHLCASAVRRKMSLLA